MYAVASVLSDLKFLLNGHPQSKKKCFFSHTNTRFLVFVLHLIDIKEGMQGDYNLAVQSCECGHSMGCLRPPQTEEAEACYDQLVPLLSFNNEAQAPQP